MRTLFFLIAVSFGLPLFSQKLAQKQLTAKRTTAAIKIDGKLDEATWKDAPTANNLLSGVQILVRWKAKKPVRKSAFCTITRPSTLQVIVMKKRPTGVSKELVGRDKIGVNDYVGVIFDTYLDKSTALVSI